MYLRQSTASQEIKLGPYLDSTDGNTAETGLTIANTDIKLTKGGATTETNKNSGGGTHVAGGRYSAVLDATDTNTLGNLEIDSHVTGALAVHRTYVVLPAVVYDAIVLGTDNLDVSVVQWLGTAAATPTTAGVPEVDVTHLGGAAQSATDLKDFADAGYDPATNKVQGVVLVDTTTTNTDMRGTDSALLAASINLTAGAVDNVTTVATTTTNTDMRGTDSALLAASINLTGGAVDTVTTVGTTTTNTDMRGTDSASTATALATAQTDLDTLTGTDGATLATAQGNYAPNTVVPDAAGVAPTATEITADIDANSTQLNTTIPGLIDDLAIKKNTAFSNFEFLMVLTSDHVTPATGLTVTGQRSINGGAFAGVAGAIAEVSNGIYQFDALSADTNGDVITWRFSSATADDTFLTFKTVA